MRQDRVWFEGDPERFRLALRVDARRKDREGDDDWDEDDEDDWDEEEEDGWEDEEDEEEWDEWIDEDDEIDGRLARSRARLA